MCKNRQVVDVKIQLSDVVKTIWSMKGKPTFVILITRTCLTWILSNMS